MGEVIDISSEIEDRRNKEVEAYNRLAILTALEAAGITKVLVEFSGDPEGLAKGIEIDAFEVEGDATKLQTHRVTIRYFDAKETMTIEDAIHYFCWDHLLANYEWATDSSVEFFGDFTFNTTNKVIKLDVTVQELIQ